jgi:Na+-transporting NADH:ubiquinone oxidoreductase subunit C
MKEVSEEIRMSVFLLLLTIVCTGLLSFGNFYYQKALAVKQKELRMGILQVFDIPYTEDNFFTVFSKSVDIVEEKKSVFYLNKDTPRQAVIISSGSGLWSVIELLIIVNLDDQTIRQLRVLSHGETPGLGGRIEEPWFLEQFIDLDISQGLKLMKEKTGAPGEVDAVTGASHTSRSVENIINDALAGLQ